MRDSILIAAPLLIAAIVLAVRFVGCTLDHTGLEISESYSSAVLSTPGLVSLWRLNETAGTAAADSSDGNAGAYENGVMLEATSHVYQDTDTYAAEFDGVSGFVDVPFAANVNPPQFTAEAVVNPSAIGDGGGSDYHAVVVSRSHDASNNQFGYVLYLHGSAFEARVGTGATDVTVVSVPAAVVAHGGPYYVAMTYDGTRLTLYVNPTDTFDPGNPGETAQQQASMATAYAPNAQSDLVIGASNFFPAGTGLFFPGVMGDVAIYDVALDFATVRSHHAVMMTGLPM